MRTCTTRKLNGSSRTRNTHKRVKLTSGKRVLKQQDPIRSTVRILKRRPGVRRQFSKRHLFANKTKSKYSTLEEILKKMEVEKQVEKLAKAVANSIKLSDA
ncbi:hypothetical protein K7432_005754 [Basidiobolus ranarum]|uniref:Uncharacterized protein n=1 Tax=Basidiobolus ranarum TaxID=34480 RepID=A0ABR2W2X2_9FUNG